MTRRNALLRLRKDLLARKKWLGKKLTDELANLRDFRTADSTRDSADLAFEADGDAISARLAELDDRELSQIDRALSRWQQRTYGICESCQKPISLARLSALPFAPFCISCEREIERNRDSPGHPTKGNWGQISDGQAPMQDQRIKLADLEMDLSSRRG